MPPMQRAPSDLLAQFERNRRLGMSPEMLADGLEGAAAPMEVDPAADAAQEEEFARQAARIKTDDYRRERMLYRAAKATGTPVDELAQQPEWSGVGEARSDDNVMPMQARFAMAQKRMDDENARMERWKSQMLLASSNSRANMSNAFGMLSPEQQQRVIESRLIGNRYNNNGDPRMAIAQLEAETRRAEGQDARASAEKIAEANRTAGREEREAVREENNLKYTATQEEGRQRHEALMEQGRQQFAAMMEKTAAGQADAARAHEIALKNIEALIAKNKSDTTTALEAAKVQADGRVKEAEITAGATADKLQTITDRQDKQMELQAMQKREAEAIAMAGPGGADLVHGRLGTPAAQDALKELASQADKTWTGFHQADAARLDAMLVKIGITDPATRRDIVQNYGINASNFPGQPGRGSRLTSMFVSHPGYAPVPTAE